MSAAFGTIICAAFLDIPTLSVRGHFVSFSCNWPSKHPFLRDTKSHICQENFTTIKVLPHLLLLSP